MAVLDDVMADPLAFAELDNEQVYSVSREDAEEFQLHWIRKRFDEMRPRIRMLDRLADDLSTARIDGFGDVSGLCFPHTFYKSYSAAHVTQGRYDKMSEWLDTLTAIDLKSVDISSCESLDDWLAALQAKTPLRALCSSGTGGKISFFPRSTAEEYVFLRNYYLFNGTFRDEPGSGLESGEVDFYTPWPVATGRHNLPVLFGLLRENTFKDKPGEHVHTLGRGHWSVDMLWLSGRLRAANARGELDSLVLSPAEQALRERIAEDAANTAANIEPFLEQLMLGNDGRKIFLFAPPKELLALSRACKQRGLKGNLSPDTYVLAPGRSGSKGEIFPDGWLEECNEIFPYPHQGIYGMTECTGHGRLCAGGHYHMPPWVFMQLLDPDTSAPLPREGVQTGRFALFDILATTYWGGAISGDRVTIDWEGGCPCGRVGPFIHDSVARYAALRDDDKITCAKSTDAYDKIVEFALGDVE